MRDTTPRRPRSLHAHVRSHWIPPQHGGWASEAGQSTLEFAVAISILFMLTFGLIDLGRMVYTASVVQAAAQEGARTGLVDMTEIAPAIYSKLAGLDTDRTQIDISQPDSNSVEVGVTYKFEFAVPLIAQAVRRDGVDLYGSASMIIH